MKRKCEQKKIEHTYPHAHAFQKQSLRKTKHKLKKKIKQESKAAVWWRLKVAKYITENKGGLMFIQELSQQCVHTCHSFRRKSSTILQLIRHTSQRYTYIYFINSWQCYNSHLPFPLFLSLVEKKTEKRAY